MLGSLSLAPVSVIGYHGTTEAAANEILSTGTFNLSRKQYDWLGGGFYFFEYAPHRAWQWAQIVAEQRGGIPAVIEATIQLGRCVNLLDTAHMDGLPEVYAALREKRQQAGLSVPRNTDRGAHFLDRDVVNLYCALAEQENSTPYQTVRGCFPEGEPVYAGSKILRRTHVQIAVRDAACITKARKIPIEWFEER